MSFHLSRLVHARCLTASNGNLLQMVEILGSFEGHGLMCSTNRIHLLQLQLRTSNHNETGSLGRGISASSKCIYALAVCRINRGQDVGLLWVKLLEDYKHG